MKNTLRRWRLYTDPPLFLARLANHLHIRNGQVSVLGRVLVHVSVGSSDLGSLLQSVRSVIADHASSGDGMSHMLAERHTVAADLPRAAVISGQQILF